MLAGYNNSPKHRTQHYEEQPQLRGNATGSVREQVQRDSPIIAELRTNVIIKDEFTLVRDLSLHLAARYTRPDSAIMVQVDHSVCLALGGNFDPCYILNVTTGPSQMGPVMNKRNAALIQSFMADILSVPPERGIVKFQPVPEENFAYNGTTLLGEIERRAKQRESFHGVPRAISHASKRNLPSLRKSTSKLDVDTKLHDPATPEAKLTEQRTGESKPAEPKTLTTMRPKTPLSPSESKRMSATLPPGVSATILSPEGIFELPAIEMERKRPTSGYRQTSSGSNGLRMNPVTQSTPDLKRKSSPGKSRPLSTDSMQLKEKRKSNSHTHSRSNPQTALLPPTPQRSIVPSSKNDRPHSFLKTEYSKSGHRHSRSSNLNRISAPMPMREKPMRMLGVRDSYIESLMGKPHLVKGFASEQTIVEKPSQELLGQGPTANEAKRRSTMTATPKIPEPPMIPEDTKSVKSAKTGKRKSFMSAFKRNVVAA